MTAAVTSCSVSVSGIGIGETADNGQWQPAGPHRGDPDTSSVGTVAITGIPGDGVANSVASIRPSMAEPVGSASTNGRTASAKSPISLNTCVRAMPEPRSADQVCGTGLGKLRWIRATNTA